MLQFQLMAKRKNVCIDIGLATSLLTESQRDALGNTSKSGLKKTHISPSPKNSQLSVQSDSTPIVYGERVPVLCS
jgi:hypothetical protein